MNEIAWASADDTEAKAKGRAGPGRRHRRGLVAGTTFPRLTTIGVLAKLGDIAKMSLVADRCKNTVWDPDNESFAATDHGPASVTARTSSRRRRRRGRSALAPSYSGKVAMLDYRQSVCNNILKVLGKPAGSSDN